jgi:hypothetical protein
MARSVNHRLGCEHLEERATPSDVGCAAAAVESAPAPAAEAMATGDTITGELPDPAEGVLGGHRVEMDADGTVIAIMPPDTPALAAPVVLDAEEVPLTSAVEFNFADDVVYDLRFNLNPMPEAKPKIVHEVTHPAGRRITEGALTWGVDALLTVDAVDVVKLILSSMGEASQAA